MCTYEDLVAVTLAHGLVPTVVPQLRTITVGGALAGLGIESSSLRNGLPHEAVLELDVLTPPVTSSRPARTTSTPTSSARSPTPTARSGTRPACGCAWTGPSRTSSSATSASSRSRRSRPRSALSPRTGVGRRAGRLLRRRPVRPWRGVPVPGPVRVTGGGPLARARTQRLHGPGDLLPLAARATSGRPAHPRLPVALGHRLVLVLARVRCAEPRGPDAVAAALAPLGRLPPDRRARRTPGPHGRLADLRHRPRNERVVQDVEVPLDQLEGFMAWFTVHVPMTPVWLCPLRLASPSRGRCTRSSRNACTSTSASGAVSRSRRAPTTAT
ncbi:hypothetical protein NKG05_02215 [Oerskovia sp. M15]